MSSCVQPRPRAAPAALRDNHESTFAIGATAAWDGRQRQTEMMMRAAIWIIGALGLSALASGVVAAQGMMQHVDLASPEMASAEMTRAEVEVAIASVASP